MKKERCQVFRLDIVPFVVVFQPCQTDAVISNFGELLSYEHPSDTLLVFAGDIYQIESIDFGNWFFYAKELLPDKAVVELTSTWRTQDNALKALWEEVRFVRPLITEMLVLDGPFSENIGNTIFQKFDDDEVVLCLNYDGKFGINSINSYFQDANPSSKVYRWFEWKYKVGDPVLFNRCERFPMLYNNLKGTIVDINLADSSICFTQTVGAPMTITHIGTFGLLAAGYYNLIGARMTGPTIGSMICLLAIAPCGAHFLNVVPIMLGYFLASLFAAFDLNTQAIVVGLCFACALCPISGCYGSVFGIIAGSIHACMVTTVVTFHGGFCLYNGGFTAGITAILMVPFLEHFVKKRRESYWQKDVIKSKAGE